mmetsp:Transcript_21166/g.44582  ORF Transcript_21166/g.44582 Transcript_21166/m.44582 type:complete len:434 (-) Transcript_21166:72-1373(-)
MEEEEDTCPLCLEQLDITDKQVEFCQCGYRMCLWCWHQIMETAAIQNARGRCPACRKEYDKERITKGQVDPATAKLAMEQEKRKKRESKLASKYKQFPGDGLSRRHLHNVRVIQRNLVYAIGVPLKHCKEDILRRAEFFGKYGKILKISVNRSGPTGRYQAGGVYNNHSNGSGPTGSAYVTFMSEQDAVNCIKRIDGSVLDGNVIRACFGTTKYCNAFLKYQQCNNADCLYLHEIGETASKEEMARWGGASFRGANKGQELGVAPAPACKPVQVQPQVQVVVQPPQMQMQMPPQMQEVPQMQVQQMQQQPVPGGHGHHNGLGGLAALAPQPPQPQPPPGMFGFPGQQGQPMPSTSATAAGGTVGGAPQQQHESNQPLTAGELFLQEISQQMMSANYGLTSNGPSNFTTLAEIESKMINSSSRRMTSRFSFASD